MSLEPEDIIGYPVSKSSIDEIVAEVTGYLVSDDSRCRYFSCLNPHAVEMAAEDQWFQQALLGSDFLTPDGIGIVHASRLLRGELRRRVTGMDVFLGVTQAMQDRGGSCFFLGSTEETLLKIRERMRVDYPDVVVAGTYSPPFKPEFSADDNQAMIDAINDSGAEVLWVGLTAPKQEKWLHQHRDSLNVRFAGPIGAAFDFYVGNIRRVGAFWGNMGLEWLPRLLQEPRRLWRRSIVSAPKFFYRTFRYRMRRRSN